MEAPESKPQFFRKKAFTFNEDEFQKALKIINQAADMGKIQVLINEGDINNVHTVGMMLEMQGFNIQALRLKSEETITPITTIMVSW